MSVAPASNTTPTLPTPLQATPATGALLQACCGGFAGGVVPQPKLNSPVRVLIAGASRGIGLELTKQYAQANPKNVVIAGVRNVKFDRIVALAKQYSNVTIVPLDLDQDESVQASVKLVEKVTDRIDILINNAGIAGKTLSPTNEVRANLAQVFNTNAAGPLAVTQAYLPFLTKSSVPELPPRVINISTGMGSTTFAAPIISMFGPAYGLAYCTSKAALNYITTALAASIPDVIIVAVHPGWVATEMAAPGAPVKTSECAQALRARIESYTKEHSGQFRDNISGELLPL